MGSAAFFSSRWHLAQLLILATDAAGAVHRRHRRHADLFQPAAPPLLFVAMSRTLRRATSSASFPRWPTA